LGAVSFHAGSGSWAKPAFVYDVTASAIAATRTKLIKYVFMDDTFIGELTSND